MDWVTPYSLLSPFGDQQFSLFCTPEERDQFIKQKLASDIPKIRELDEAQKKLSSVNDTINLRKSEFLLCTGRFLEKRGSLGHEITFKTELLKNPQGLSRDEFQMKQFSLKMAKWSKTMNENEHTCLKREHEAAIFKLEGEKKQLEADISTLQKDIYCHLFFIH